MHRYDLNRCYKKLKSIVIKAGNKAKRKINNMKVARVKEKDDIVTDTDLLIEQIIFSSISKYYPDHGFNSEEMGQHKNNSDYVWILDPIDGTKYYAKGLPIYSVSLALEYKHSLIQGIVYIPETGQLFCANSFDNRGALLNKKRIYCSSEEDVKNCIVCLEIPSNHDGTDTLSKAIANMNLIINKAKRVRIIGVGSVGICYCAAGGFDVYLNLGSNYSYHDYAAGKVIVEQAGGEFRRLQNSLIAGNPVIVKKVMDLLELV